MFTKGFWKAAFERAVKSAANALLLQIGASTIDVLNFDWERAVGFTLGAAVVSILMSIISSQVGASGGPSLTDAEVPAPGA